VLLTDSAGVYVERSARDSQITLCWLHLTVRRGTAWQATIRTVTHVRILTAIFFTPCLPY